MKWVEKHITHLGLKFWDLNIFLSFGFEPFFLNWSLGWKTYHQPVTNVLRAEISRPHPLEFRQMKTKCGARITCQAWLVAAADSKIWKNGILLPKLFWPTVRKNCSSNREKLLKFEAEGREFVKFWDHLNNLFKQGKVRTIFGNRMLFNLFLEVSHI